MFLQTLAQVIVVVAAMIVVSTAAFAGRQRLVETTGDFRRRVAAILPIVLVLVSVLLFNSVARDLAPEVSWMIGWELTGMIYDIEGDFIVWLQAQATPELTAYFSFIYIYGYVFVLVFPVIAYFLLPNTRPIRELLAAYTLNYTLGLVCYVFVIAYGPRNMMPELIQALLYDTYPQYQHLTRQVNRNTNVFPSLHASLSTTVALLAYRTREVYRGWFWLAVWLAVSVSLSTMYLGIHWAIDVVAGIGLAWLAVELSTHLVGRWSVYDGLERRGLWNRSR
ncbi:phosphatase PAP2 family protein [Natronosalvus rutilus]|uniref:Phosphatase PAP2 family protein n=1 Tax=Natronosalvus rutilus TaxID=2953753 RepID=A0A9E7NAY4_9EURY|nr:phosphatase PAP2 family protein [Natronosalvus rutilus]UTF54081.1 phosphatase PAP2 family protein [Natronosalvus rutilus]